MLLFKTIAKVGLALHSLCLLIVFIMLFFLATLINSRFLLDSKLSLLVIIVEGISLLFFSFHVTSRSTKSQHALMPLSPV